MIGGGHFWFKKQDCHLNYIQRTKGIFNEYNSFTLFWAIASREVIQNFWEVMLIMIPFTFPIEKANSESNSILSTRVKKYAVLSSILFGAGYLSFTI